MEIHNKQFIFILLVSLFLGLTITSKTILLTVSPKDIHTTPKPLPEHMKITSSAFGNEGTIPVTYTCGAENKNPPISISNVPAKAKTLALVIEDPDAPLGPFIHWILWNIPAGTKDILAGSVPALSQQGTNSFNHIGYNGPCPPSRHRYYFTLYALDISPGLDGKAKISDLDKSMKGHVLDQAELIGSYGN
jgi:hypothetical protein